MTTIVMSQDGEAHVARLQGRPEVFGVGRTEAEAVGQLVMDHGLRFHIEVKNEVKTPK